MLCEDSLLSPNSHSSFFHSPKTPNFKWAEWRPHVYLAVRCDHTCGCQWDHLEVVFVTPRTYPYRGGISSTNVCFLLPESTMSVSPSHCPTPCHTPHIGAARHVSCLTHGELTASKILLRKKLLCCLKSSYFGLFYCKPPSPLAGPCYLPPWQWTSQCADSALRCYFLP